MQTTLRKSSSYRYGWYSARKISFKKKLLSALKDGFGFCDVILGWDSNDQIYDDVKYTGWSSGFPDAHVMPIPETARFIPFENDLLFF